MEGNQNSPQRLVPNKIHVTGFPMYTQPQDLEKLFSEYGNGKVDRITKRYATLVFKTNEEARAAIAQSKKIAVYGEVVSVKPYHTNPTTVTTPKKENWPIKKGRTLVSPDEILLTGEFDEQLENVLMAIRLTQEEVEKISELYSDLERVLQAVWPGCTAVPFGSITTGLGVKSSDADCFISIPAKMRHPNANYIKKAKKVLQAHRPLFSDIVPIPMANTPIIKLYHEPSRTHCDLTFKTPLGTRNSRLVRFLLHADARLLPLAVLLRYWASVHGFTAARRLTNYALTMLLLFYLQQPPHALLPAVRWLQRDPAHACLVDHWDVGFLEDFATLPRSADASSVAELLGGFFRYYSTFDFNELIVCPYLGFPIKKALFEDSSTLPPGFERYQANVQNNISFALKFTTPVCVQDPFEHSHNVACGISSKLAGDLCTLFDFGASAFEREKISGYRGFLRTILLERPRMFGVKYPTEYKCNVNYREINGIKNSDWKSVMRDVTEVIFGQIFGFDLDKVEEKMTETLKEKVTFTTKATKAVWRRKYNSKVSSPSHTEFLERQTRLTREIIKADKQTFELDFQLEQVFTNDLKRFRIGLKYLKGDKELFRELGIFFTSIINPWYRILLQPHRRPPHPAHDSAAPPRPDHVDEPDGDDADESDSDVDDEPNSEDADEP